MYRPAIGIVLAAATALSGCAQSTRHSNTMIFGTNTVFGISAGADATSTPSVTVGYKRQEAVVLPLYANVDEAGAVLKPCRSSGVDLVLACKFQGTGGGEDTYSVLASFGANFYASTTGAPRASGQIAQYFATGHAARALATRAGAAAVATSAAAEANALPPEVGVIIDQRERLRGTIADNLAGAAGIATAADVAVAMSKLDAAVRSGTRFARACAAIDKLSCVAVIRNGTALGVASLPTDKLDLASKHAF